MNENIKNYLFMIGLIYILFLASLCFIMGSINISKKIPSSFSYGFGEIYVLTLYEPYIAFGIMLTLLSFMYYMFHQTELMLFSTMIIVGVVVISVFLFYDSLIVFNKLFFELNINNF